MNPFTILQSLYWQKVKLHDKAWGIERRIASIKERGNNAIKLLERHASILKEITTIEKQMLLIESGDVA